MAERAKAHPEASVWLTERFFGRLRAFIVVMRKTLAVILQAQFYGIDSIQSRGGG